MAILLLIISILLAAVISYLLFNHRSSYYDGYYDQHYGGYYPPFTRRHYNNGAGAGVFLGLLSIIAIFIAYQISPNNKDGPVTTDDRVQISQNEDDLAIYPSDSEIQNEYDELNHDAEQYDVTPYDIPYEEGTYYIQNGAYSTLESAQSEWARLRQALDYKIGILVESHNDAIYYKVLIGPFLTDQSAKDYKNEYDLFDAFIRSIPDYPEVEYEI